MGTRSSFTSPDLRPGPNTAMNYAMPPRSRIILLYSDMPPLDRCSSSLVLPFSSLDDMSCLTAFASWYLCLSHCSFNRAIAVVTHLPVGRRTCARSPRVRSTPTLWPGLQRQLSMRRAGFGWHPIDLFRRCRRAQDSIYSPYSCHRVCTCIYTSNR